MLLRQNSVYRSSLFVAGLLALLASASCGQPTQPAQTTPSSKNKLVIVGGALKPETEDIWNSFLAGIGPEDKIVIVPAASGEPHQSAQAARDGFIDYGASSQAIEIAPLAKLDDTSTPDVNEASWAANADSPDLETLLRNADGIWFTGGDQTRITELLVQSDGSASRALSAIWEAIEDGAVIGGTSAGAAIMSKRMIQQGNSFAALTGADKGEPLKISQGLGFFEPGLVDQHFGERARLGRLIVALLDHEAADQRIGFGIDEDTALIMRSDDQLEVRGSGYVTIVDARASVLRRDNGQIELSGVIIHLLSTGDTIDGATLQISPSAWKSPTIGNEYYDVSPASGTGIAFPLQSLASILSRELLDNKRNGTIERMSFDNTGNGIVYRFTQTPQSMGYWGRDENGNASYTLTGISFEAFPTKMTIADDN